MDEALAALPSGVGVLAEMVNPETGDFLGNLPQGLSHLALIHAGISLDGGLRKDEAERGEGAAVTTGRSTPAAAGRAHARESRFRRNPCR